MKMQTIEKIHEKTEKNLLKIKKEFDELTKLSNTNEIEFKKIKK